MGQLLKEQEFEHDGKKYAVRAVASGDGVKVRSFLGEKPANWITYSVSWETNMDLATLRSASGIDMLMEIARTDIERGLTWDAQESNE